MIRDDILHQLRERILGFAPSKVLREAAEDLVQEVLIVLHEKYPEITALRELLPLSLQILRYKILDCHRKSFRRGEYNQESVEELPLPASGDNPETELVKKQRLERLIVAFDQLSNRCRQLFRWKLEGKKFSEIQSLLGATSINTVYTWDQRCLRRIKEKPTPYQRKLKKM
jgi:RNA polymerase sigma-70 factor (ECF subfamily)